MPKFPDILLNNNPDAPSVDLNDLQVKGVGIFADAAARDALNSNLHTEGYLAIMKDTDTPFIYTGGTWTDAANWAEVKGLWDEDGLGIKYTTTSGSVSILESTRPYQGNIITGLFGSSQSAPGGSRAARKLLHLHEGQLIFSTETNTPISHIEMSNQTHSAGVGGAIGTSSYNMRIHGYHALEFTHGGVNFTQGSMMVSMDMPPSSANTGSISIGKIDSYLGGISLPSFGYGTVNTTNYSLSLGGRIIFKNHSSIEWDAIKQNSVTTAAGVEINAYQTSNALNVRRSDGAVTGYGTYAYVGVNVNSPSATGPAFEVSSSYGKFNNGLHIGDITATGYAFPTATGTTGQVLKVDANGDLVFGDDIAGLWTEDTNGITYTAGNVGIGAASSSNFDLNVGSGIILEAGQLLFSSVSDGIKIQSAFNTTAGVSIGYQALASGGAGAVAIGNRVNSPNSGTVVIGYSGQQMSGYTATDPRAVHIGYSAGMTATTATDTVAIGNNPLSSLTTGSGNLAIGRTAGSSITTESRNTFIGYEAGRLTTSSYNTFIGNEAGESVTTGMNVTAVGSLTRGASSTGSNSVMVGANSSATGSDAIAIGKSVANGSESISIGGAARANSSQSIAVGYETHAGSSSIVIGNRANKYTGTSSSNIILGFGDRATFGNSNISVGNSFLINRDDSATLRPRSNVSLGHNNFNYSPLNSYNNLVVGGSNFSTSGASAEIAYNAVMSTGLVGTGSPMRNTVIGQRNGTGQAVLGDDNVFLGYNAGFNETSSNKLYIANSNTTTPLIYGEFDNALCRVNGNFQRVVFGSTETTTSGTIHIRDNTNWATQADATDNTASTGLLGIALGSAANAGLVLFGDVDYTITGNVGTPVYLDTTAGGLTITSPTGSGNIVRVMGYIIGTNKVFFNPSNDWLEIV